MISNRTRSTGRLGAALAVTCLTLAGCAGMSDTEQRTTTGALGGAAVGGVVGAIAGHTPAGLAIGTVAGAAGGYLYSEHKKHEANVYDQGYAAGAAQ
jgi:uncharacterized protein YcfJ